MSRYLLFLVNQVCFLCVPPYPVCSPLNKILSFFEVWHICICPHTTVRRVFFCLTFSLTRPPVDPSLYFSKKRKSPGTVHAVKLQSFNIPNESTSTNHYSVPYRWEHCPFGTCNERCTRHFAQEGTLSDDLCVSP